MMHPIRRIWKFCAKTQSDKLVVITKDEFRQAVEQAIDRTGLVADAELGHWVRRQMESEPDGAVANAINGKRSPSPKEES